MSRQKKANLFVVGAMKARTTRFTDSLSKHLDIYMSPIKEPLYFVESAPKQLYEASRFFDLGRYLENDFPEPLHIAKVSTLQQYEQLFSLQKEEKYLAEASTFYLHSPGSPQKIMDYNPNAKIIILLRNPLERAFSHYRMDVGLGREKRSFIEIMRNQIDQYKNGELAWYSYLGMSFYGERISVYKKHFNEVLVIFEGDFKKGNKAIFQKVAQFLAVEPFEYQVDKKINETRTLKFPALLYHLKKLGLKDYFSKFVGKKTKQKLFESLSTAESVDANLPSDLEEELVEIFKQESPQF